jgi:hypothetical protein
MAGRISELVPANALDGTELIETSQTQSGSITSARSTINAIATFIKSLTSPWTKAQVVAPVKNATATGSVALDFTSSNSQRLLVTGNLTLANPTLAASSGSDGVVVNVYLKQDATGGRTFTFGTKYKWPGGAAPTWITTPNAVNFISMYYDATDDIVVCNGAPGVS